jgi:hypothetical protein
MVLLAACSPKSEQLPPALATPVTVAAVPAAAEPGTSLAQKQQPFSPAEEKRIVQAAKAQVTADGATVLQVLQHAAKMRPNEFKLASVEMMYSEVGQPSVGVCYWMGSKRLPGDQYCDIGYTISADHKTLSPEFGDAPSEVRAQMTVTAVMQGRDAFLKSVDEHYETDCIDYYTKNKTC